MKLQYGARSIEVVSFAMALFLVSTHLGASADETIPREIFAQGFYLLQHGQASKAVDKFEQGLKVDPNNAEAHYYLGEAYQALSRDDLAKEHYESSLLIDAHSEVADYARKRLADMHL